MAKFPLGASTKRLTADLAYKTTGPTINRGQGNNNASTPWKFIHPVGQKFGPLSVDLAATKANKKAPWWLGPDSPAGRNSLEVRWASLSLDAPDGICWLNPPYFNITVWARKCAAEVELGARILLLVPGSIGANWLWDWVVPYADVYSVGRMVFDDCYDRDGKLITTPYPKDLVLAYYDWSREAEKAGRRTGESYGDAHLGGRAEIIRWRWQDA